MDHVKRVRAWLEDKGYDGVVLSRRDNFTWVSGGAKNAVCTNTEVGIGHYVIDAEGIRLLADSSDAPRMGKEQNPLEGETILVPWYTSMDDYIGKMAEGKTYASDTGIAGTKNVQEELVRLRMQLCPEEESCGTARSDRPALRSWKACAGMPALARRRRKWQAN